MADASRWKKLRPSQLALLAGLFVVAALLSHAMATALRGGVAPAHAALEGTAADTLVTAPFASGRYLAAFVFAASGCGFSSHPTTMEALRQVPGLLRAGAGAEFADVSVIGVALDVEPDTGVRFLRELEHPGARFDEVSAGNSWMNEQAIRLMWRDGAAAPLLPQVVLIERQVDARMYPRHIEVRDDSVILNVVGRDDILRWVAEGAPLQFGGPRR